MEEISSIFEAMFAVFLFAAFVSTAFSVFFGGDDD